MSSNLRDVTNVRTHWYNMFHGTRDENVHFQNSAQLSKKLISENIDFGAWYSADDDHGMACLFSFKPPFTGERRSGWQTNNVFPRLVGCRFRPNGHPARLRERIIC